jgi:hypothetical protein
MTPKDKAEVEEHIEAVKDTLKTQELQQDLDRRSLDAAMADEFSDGPIPFNVADEDGEPGASDGPGDAGGGSTSGPNSTIGQHRLNRVKTQLRNLNIEHQMMRLGKDTGYKIWDVEGVGNKKKLVVITNIDHPFYMVIQDGFMLWVKHNIVEAVAEFFTQETGTTESMLLIKSDILKHIGKMNIELIEESDEGSDEKVS